MESPPPGPGEAGGKTAMRGLSGRRRGCHHAQHAAQSPGETLAPRTPLPASPVFPAGRCSMQPDGEESGRYNLEVSAPKMESRAWKGLQS